MTTPSWLGKIDAYLVSLTTGNIFYRNIEEKEGIKERDVFVYLNGDNQKTVKHVINGEKVVVFSKSKILTNDPLSFSPMGGVIGQGFPPGHYRKNVVDEGLLLCDIANGIILIDNSKKTITPNYLWEDNEFWNELNRRNLILYALPIDPMIRKSKGTANNHH